MWVKDSYYFFKNETTNKDSGIFYTSNKGIMTLEVYGTSTTFTLTVKGIMDNNNESDWSTLCGINSELTKVGTSISEKGIYTYGIDGYNKIMITLSDLTDGNITVFAEVGE